MSSLQAYRSSRLDKGILYKGFGFKVLGFGFGVLGFWGLGV